MCETKINITIHNNAHKQEHSNDSKLCLAEGKNINLTDIPYYSHQGKEASLAYKKKKKKKIRLIHWSHDKKHGDPLISWQFFINFFFGVCVNFT